MVSRYTAVYLGVALLVVYGMLLPGATVNRAAAHDLGWDLVSSTRILGYHDAIPSKWNLGVQVTNAREAWEDYVGIRFSRSSSPETDVVFVSICHPKSDALGWIQRSPPQSLNDGTIWINSCVVAHNGGRVKRADGTRSRVERPATVGSRRARTFVHEFGHALGLNHTRNLNHIDSVMSEYKCLTCKNGGPERLANNVSTVYLPTPHDISDVRRLWP